MPHAAVMVRSVFNSSGGYVGHLWGTQNWGSPDIGEFYGRAMTSKKTLGPFLRIADAERAIAAQFSEGRGVIAATFSRPPPRQLSLPLS